MKYVGFILGIAGLYFYFSRTEPEHPAVKAAIEAVDASTPIISLPTNALKRPVDRTREVLSQVPRRNGAGEF